MKPDVDPVIDRIRESVSATGSWGLRSDEVVSLLDIDRAELYRRTYVAGLGKRSAVDVSAATGTFGPENAGELVALLELFYGRSAERDLERAGVFFGYVRRIDIAEAFLSVGARKVAAHVVDEPRFSAMLRALGRYERARDAYLAELPSVDELIRESVNAFCRGKDFGSPELAARTVEATLRLFLRRKVLSMDDVLQSVVSRLRAQAVREGYVRAKPRPSPEEQGVELDAAALERTRAQHVLELSGRRLTVETLRSQYRSLMKRYHPDLNPAGLERAKEINAAYALLAAALVE